MNKGKIITLTILMPLLVLAALITSLFLLGNLLGYILSSKDGYLLTGLAFYLLTFLIIILIPIILYLLVSKKGQRKIDIKNWFKKYTVLFIIFILMITVLESVIGINGYRYYKDIMLGPQEQIMTNAVIKVRHSRRGHHTYIIGNIAGKEEKFNITRAARSKVFQNETYKKIIIKYYKNIKEVFDVKKYYRGKLIFPNRNWHYKIKVLV